MTKSNDMELIVLGRSIGTFTGWDQTDDQEQVFYGFKPAETVKLPAGDLAFNHEDGRFKVYDDDGKVVQKFDSVSVLAHLPSLAPLT